MCEAVAAELAEERLKCRNIGMKLKLTDFTLRSRAVTASRYLSTADELFKYVV